MLISREPSTFKEIKLIHSQKGKKKIVKSSLSFEVLGAFIFLWFFSLSAFFWLVGFFGFFMSFFIGWLIGGLAGLWVLVVFGSVGFEIVSLGFHFLVGSVLSS